MKDVLILVALLGGSAVLCCLVLSLINRLPYPLSNAARLVRDFHEKYGHAIGVPCLPGKIDQQDLILRGNLIREESNETLTALDDLYNARYLGDQARARKALIDSVDGMCDLVYVVLGTAVSMGIDLDEHFREVHRANMDKIPMPMFSKGEKYAPGGGKPAGWKGPDHERLLALAESQAYPLVCQEPSTSI